MENKKYRFYRSLNINVKIVNLTHKKITHTYERIMQVTLTRSFVFNHMFSYLKA